MSKDEGVSLHIYQKVDEASLELFTAQLKNKLSDKQVILLTGSLGAGKTSFVTAFLKNYNFNKVDSPTYSIINEYDVNEVGQKIVHVDLYRLESEADVESTGFWDLFDEKKGLIFIEWPERISISDIASTWSVWTVEIKVESDTGIRSYDLRSL